MLAKLRDHRKALKMTQNDLALKMNTTRRSIIRWEKGQCKPSTVRMQQLAEIMGCSPEDFFDN